MCQQVRCHDRVSRCCMGTARSAAHIGGGVLPESEVTLNASHPYKWVSSHAAIKSAPCFPTHQHLSFKFNTLKSCPEPVWVIIVQPVSSNRSKAVREYWG